MVFRTDEERETGAKSIRKKAFRVGGDSIDLVVANFGETASRRDTVWQFPTSILDTPEVVIKAVESFVTGAGRTCPGFALKRHLQGQVQLNTWSIQFEGKVAWVAKQLQIGSSTRLVTEEGSTCLLCSNKGHTSWACPEKKGVRLSEVLARHKGLAGSSDMEE